MACLEKLCAQIPTQQVSAMTIDGTSATLLLTDDQNQPLTPGFMYNDMRAAQQAALIAQHASPETAAQGASCTLAKLLWFYAQAISSFKTRKKVFAKHQADWLAAKLYRDAEHQNITDTNNALKMGYDPQLKCWPQWMLDLLSEKHIPHDVLPQVVTPGTNIGVIDPVIADELSLPQTTYLVAGTTDSTASFLATGARQPGEAVTILGSTLVIKIICEKPVYSAVHGVYSHPLNIDGRELWLAGGSSNSGGAVLRQYFSQQQIQAMTALLQPNKLTGLDYYPLPGVGERFPLNDPHLSSRLEPRPDNDVTFFQGILEGIARIEAQGYQLLHELGAPYPDTIRTTGGGAANKAWTAIRRGLLKPGVTMLEATQTEAAFGSALLARQNRHT
jgi:sugar (pentulose or hexulose) kinase